MSELYDKGTDPMPLEPYYCRHIRAMTAEGLHSKGDIALELARRDKRIAELERENAELKSRLESSKIVNSKMAEEFFDLKRTAEERLTRLRAVVRAARRPANLPALLQTLRALLPGDAEGGLL